MSRKAIQTHEDVQPTIARIRAFCDMEKMSVLALAKASGVEQSPLFRFLEGERKTVTMTAKAVLEYIDKRHNWHNPDMIPADVKEAVHEVWDGNPHTVNFLANLIRALKPALEVATLSQGVRKVGRAK